MNRRLLSNDINTEADANSVVLKGLAPPTWPNITSNLTANCERRAYESEGNHERKPSVLHTERQCPKRGPDDVRFQCWLPSRGHGQAVASARWNTAYVVVY